MVGIHDNNLSHNYAILVFPKRLILLMYSMLKISVEKLISQTQNGNVTENNI